MSPIIRSGGHKNFWYDRKSIMTRNVHVKYESPPSNVSEVKVKVKVLKIIGQRSWSLSYVG